MSITVGSVIINVAFSLAIRCIQMAKEPVLTRKAINITMKFMKMDSVENISLMEDIHINIAFLTQLRIVLTLMSFQQTIMTGVMNMIH